MLYSFYQTAADMVADATDREPFRSSDAKSGSSFERLRIGGERFVLKSLSYEEDWIMRVTGDLVHRPFLSWRAGLYHATPDCIDHTIVAMAVEGQGTRARLSMLMHDIGARYPELGTELASVLLAAMVVFELAGPLVLQWALRLAGDVKT